MHKLVLLGAIAATLLVVNQHAKATPVGPRGILTRSSTSPTKGCGCRS